MRMVSGGGYSPNLQPIMKRIETTSKTLTAAAGRSLECINLKTKQHERI